MAEDTKIQWASHTFNPWRGCTKVSAGCANCYAETLSGRNPKTLGVWGPNGTRVVAAEAQWKLPVKWNAVAALAEQLAAEAERNPPVGYTVLPYQRPRVFCASLGDVFEDWQESMKDSGSATLYVYDEGFAPGDSRKDIVWRHGGWSNNPNRYIPGRPLTMDDVRMRLFSLIAATPYLDWLLLTKRPQNVLQMTYEAWCKPVPGHVSQNEGDGRHWHWPKNVWLGTSVENQAAADERSPHLLATPAAVRFLSCEPLLSEVDLRPFIGYGSYRGNIRGRCVDIDGMSLHVEAKCRTCGWGYPNDPDKPGAVPGIDWCIVGGESGPGSRPMRIEWARSLVAQCKAAGVPVFVKQMGSAPAVDYYTDDPEIREAALEGCGRVLVPEGRGGAYHEHNERDGQPPPGTLLQLRLEDKKGGDPGEWPEDLRVRDFPQTEART